MLFLGSSKIVLVLVLVALVGGVLVGEIGIGFPRDRPVTRKSDPDSISELILVLVWESVRVVLGIGSRLCNRGPVRSASSITGVRSGKPSQARSSKGLPAAGQVR